MHFLKLYIEVIKKLQINITHVSISEKDAESLQ